MTAVDLDLRLRRENGTWTFECRSLDLVATAEILVAASSDLLALARAESAPLAAAEAHLKAESARRLARLRLLMQVLEPLAEVSRGE